MDDIAPVWPDLPYDAWHETAATLHLWMQIVGKIRLALTPWINQAAGPALRFLARARHEPHPGRR